MCDYFNRYWTQFFECQRHFCLKTGDVLINSESYRFLKGFLYWFINTMGYYHLMITDDDSLIMWCKFK